MDKFERAYEMTGPDGKIRTIEEFSQLAYDGEPIEVYRNSKYQCFKRVYKSKEDGKINLVWLSVKRNDKEAIHDWRDLQEIKNQILGPQCEAVELYPAESRVVDGANQFHLWGVDDPNFRFPFGFKEGEGTGRHTPEEAKKYGAKQRPFEA